MINLNETIQRIRAVGAHNARSVPMAGESIDGQHQIEIKEDSGWQPIVSGITKRTAEDIISQATNKVILG